jgi:hypothetical protein
MIKIISLFAIFLVSNLSLAEVTIESRDIKIESLKTSEVGFYVPAAFLIDNSTTAIKFYNIGDTLSFEVPAALDGTLAERDVKTRSVDEKYYQRLRTLLVPTDISDRDGVTLITISVQHESMPCPPCDDLVAAVQTKIDQKAVPDKMKWLKLIAVR